MPTVSEAFVKNAQALAESLPALQTKLAEAEKKASEAEKVAAEKTAQVQHPELKPLVEATVNTLVQQGLIPATEKTAAATSLLSHEETLQALVKTAQMVRADSMGSAEKVASAAYDSTTRGDEIRASDRMLLSRLGFSV
jgi:acetyl-CoA carboxylase carboxyltransferase component